ncbi:MAG: hypothetical protein EWV53_00790 [Microcystis panniformis Mp_MB_F_20051200_S9]|jgi:hypothetical protein|uniref:Uncharacterized protein n=3 Tax=Microcystis TaxID=1125 RepID=A0A841V0J2_MICAE|nr:hypothetical protein [Microcystis aeruginosa]MDY7047883.1 hypothetical protein [Microcystis panniformis WG22]NCR53367.1 hypothetical protein [Microcystis aeruginosa L211-07]TRU31133.1 MAG: hypothetical protein EWV78_21965 [Microcystis aeruginosa Ma_MB_F_20061100_S20D]TRU41116.1 MAG: hypothetical protein EWV50_06185 [Microcystis aeruginosa Ma_MB_F_20061100_S20]TRV49708.1 MAG: hypothetical protein EWV43_07840 [Microcystis panniformis Mp_MB_F_20080800_S26D]TRV53361.1 MAG: hypothetical protein
MYLLLEVASGKFPVYFVAVYVVGFLAAVTIGSIAWYNSKRPVGWEDAQRPDIVPEVKTDIDSDSRS